MDENETKPVQEPVQEPVQDEKARLTFDNRPRKLSSIFLSLMLVLILAGAGSIVYLSVLSSNTLHLISSISQLQYETEQLRQQITANSPHFPAADATASFRRSLLELKSGNVGEPYHNQINTLALQGGQFAEQAEQVGFTNSMLQLVARQLTDRVREGTGSAESLAIYQQLSAYLLSVLHASDSISVQESLNRLNSIRLGLEQQIVPLSSAEKQQVLDVTTSLVPALLRYFQYRSVIEAVTQSSFPDELRQLKSTLFQSDLRLNLLTRLFTLLVAVIGAGGIGFSILRLRGERAQTMQPAAMVILHESEPESLGSSDTAVTVSTIELSANVNASVDPEESLMSSQVEGAISQELVLDTQCMLDNMDGDREAVAMLLDVFLVDHGNDAKRLSASLDNGQSNEVSLIAHSLKGIASSFGAEPLRRIAEHIEFRCKQGLAIEPEHTRQLSEAIETLKIAISEFLQPSPRAGIRGEVQAEGYPEAKRQAVVDAPQSRFPRVERKDESLALLNIAYMLSTMDGDVESVKMLLEIFIDEHALDAKKLQQLVYRRAPDTICETARRLVHSLKGVAGSLGAEALKQQVECIESYYKQQQVVADAEYRKLAIILDDTVEAAIRYLTEQPAVVA